IKGELMRTLIEYRRAAVEDRRLVIDGLIDDKQADSFRRQVNKALRQMPDSELVVELNTIGGYVRATIDIYSDLTLLAAEGNVKLVCKSKVMSAGIYLLGAVDLANRLSFPNTHFYHHYPTIDLPDLSSITDQDSLEYTILEINS